MYDTRLPLAKQFYRGRTSTSTSLLSYLTMWNIQPKQLCLSLRDSPSHCRTWPIPQDHRSNRAILLNLGLSYQQWQKIEHNRMFTSMENLSIVSQIPWQQFLTRIKARFLHYLHCCTNLFEQEKCVHQTWMLPTP